MVLPLLLRLGGVAGPDGLDPLNGPQVQLQGIPGRLAGALEDLVLPAQLLRHALHLQPELLRAVVRQLPEGDALQPQGGQHGVPLLVIAPQRQAQHLLPLHALLHPGQIAGGGRRVFVPLHLGQLPQGLA